MAQKKKPEKIAHKKIDKQMTTLKKGLAKEVTFAKKISKQTKEHDEELEALKAELEKLKARKKRSYLSDYNRFMRAQIRAGKTFKQAVALWKKKKKDDERKSKVSKRTAYNIFISAQLKQGKTMKQAIVAWNDFKSGKVKKKIVYKKIISKPKVIYRKSKPEVVYRKKLVYRNKIVPKVVYRNKVVKKEVPKVVYRNRIVKTEVPKVIYRRKIVKQVVPKVVYRNRIIKPVEKPEPKPVRTVRIVRKTIFPEEEIERIASRIRPEMHVVEKEVFPAEKIKEVIDSVMHSKPETIVHYENEISDEETALRMLEIYLKEVAWLGRKYNFDVDQMINTYFYALSRVKRKDIEIDKILEALNKEKIRRFEG